MVTGQIEASLWLQVFLFSIYSSTLICHQLYRTYCVGRLQLARYIVEQVMIYRKQFVLIPRRVD
ncbi:hypothetical protein P152DRAFT_282873 [Eremomyces bilateralis CBS 781.70]|uniref:Uncharacterized protein n=1 Tax=Eremomyces bilateralis CBS 781.70 TaxID=1392243 RepID=A0A6G1G9G7_9PEZI|nr:uncharacterized protein P152DRAFT_282873 [Eremomyces bilateralis CBS 781.70]KAF1814663.1 hypothetical protein P152DRAFT_282873 [Eremomyces bilateralis CBS 781.70]